MTAGYSGTPLSTKLGVMAGTRFAVIGAPQGFVASVAPLPPRVALQQLGAAEADVILMFVSKLSALKRAFPAAARRMPPDSGMLWVAWPKKASGVATDLSFDVVQKLGLAAGLVDTKICAIDEAWSGLRFSRRRKQ